VQNPAKTPEDFLILGWISGMILGMKCNNSSDNTERNIKSLMLAAQD
jgi:hypothetical protein